MPSTWQGCQMVYFETRNPNLGKFGNEKFWYILWPFGLSGNLVYFHRFAIWYQEKSVNPATYMHMYICIFCDNKI
jgi:hypothetical protein